MTKRTAIKVYKITKKCPKQLERAFKVPEKDLANFDWDEGQILQFVDGDKVIEILYDDLDEAIFCDTVSFIYFDGVEDGQFVKRNGTFYFAPEWLRSVRGRKVNGKKQKNRKLGVRRLFWAWDGGELNLIENDLENLPLENKDWKNYSTGFCGFNVDLAFNG